MHALARLCVRRPVFATMLILSLIVVGVFSYFSLGLDLFPKIDIPTVAVSVTNPGASPEEVETEITKKIEDTVNTISQVDEVRSTSSEGFSLVIITFDLSKDGDVAAIKVSRGGRTQSVAMAMAHISEETLAQIIGVHVLEAHLAYMDEGQAHEEH